jgi:(p)ppGpp synthase/HD superfamily hydrolase
VGGAASQSGEGATGQDLWRRAAAFAARAHRHHARRDGATPYVAHPVRVAMSLPIVFGCDDAQAAAIALLHDTIEDTTTDYEDLLDGFGPVVADGVAALTKDGTRRGPSRRRAGARPGRPPA